MRAMVGKEAQVESKTPKPATEDAVVSVAHNVGLPMRPSRPRKWAPECERFAAELNGSEPGANVAVVLANPKAARSFRAAFARYKAEHGDAIRTQVYIDHPDTVYLVVTE